MPAARVTYRALSAIAWYPCFIALAWVIQIVVENDVDPIAAHRSIALVAVASVALAASLRLVLRDTAVSGVIALTVVLALLRGHSALTVLPILLLAMLVLVAYRFELRGRIRLPWGRVHEALSVVAAILLVLGVANYASAIARRPVATYDPAWYAPVQPKDLPNLYVVIADGHGRADVLRDAYGYDMATFHEDLARLGFDVAASSWANYPSTQLSLASFFSGSHLAELGFDMSREPDQALLSAALRNNPATELLRRLGYRVVDIPSGFDHLAERFSDQDLDTGELSELEYQLLQTSAPGLWFQHPIEETWLSALRSRTRAGLQELEDAARPTRSSPQAVFLHLPLPHQPFVFDGECNPRPLDRLTFQNVAPDGPDAQKAMQLIGAQTRCVDRLLAASLETVVAADPTAIVLMLSDHGPDARLTWDAPTQAGLRDRIACLLALRSPGHERLLPGEVSLVNVLPRLFNSYYGTSLPYRPDEAWIPRSRSDRTLQPAAVR